MTTALETARAAAEKAAEKLRVLEAVEVEKAAQEATQRDAAQARRDQAFLSKRQELEAQVRGDAPSAEGKAEALKAGILPALVAEFLARRDAVNQLRDHARSAMGRLGQDGRTLTDLRYVDPGDELRRWTDDAMSHVRGVRSAELANAVLADFEVSA